MFLQQPPKANIIIPLREAETQFTQISGGSRIETKISDEIPRSPVGETGSRSDSSARACFCEFRQGTLPL